jgi:dTDP-4-dehydrorhamnose reductase
MKIILLGSSGYIGSAFKREIERRGITVICPFRISYDSFKKMDYFLRAHKPYAVINCAAFITKPSVDLCEDHKSKTLAGNLVLPVNISNACEVTNTKLLHVSTGCLYNGHNGGKGFSESDAPHMTFDAGAGVYVGSKQLAEVSITNPDTYICRIRIPFDEIDHERNYLSKLQRYEKVYSNLNSLSHRGDFVSACLDLLGAGAPFGTYNVTNEGAITAREITEMMTRTLRIPREFKFWDENEFMATVARTVKTNCTLDISKLLAAGVKMRHVRDAVQCSLDNWVVEHHVSQT